MKLKMKDKVEDKLIQAALVTFSEYGYAATTTRMIASEAGVNIAAISYYFRGKEGLYLHLVKVMVGKYRDILLPLREKVLAELKQADKKQIKAILLNFLTNMTKNSLDSEFNQFARITLREQNNPSDAFPYIYENMTHVVFSTIGACLKALVPNETELYYALTTQSLIAEAMLFLAFKGNLRHELSVQSFNEVHLEKHARILSGFIDSIAG